MAENSWSGSKQPVVHLLPPLGSRWHWFFLQHLRHKNCYLILPILFMNKLDGHPPQKKTLSTLILVCLKQSLHISLFDQWEHWMPETLVLLIFFNTFPSIPAVTSTFELPFKKRWRKAFLVTDDVKNTCASLSFEHITTYLDRHICNKSCWDRSDHMMYYQQLTTARTMGKWAQGAQRR